MRHAWHNQRAADLKVHDARELFNPADHLGHKAEGLQDKSRADS